MDPSLKLALNALLAAEIIAALAATIFYNKIRHTPARLLLLILWSIVLTEQLGSLMASYRFWLYDNTYS